MAADLKGRRLFVAALGNDSLEVVDLRTGTRAAHIEGLSEPQGVLYIPETRRFVVSNGGDGTCRVYDADSLKEVSRIDLGEDADNMRHDAQAKRIYVGYGDGALCAIDATTLRRVSDTKLDGHPEAFELEQTGPRIFVNIPSASEIAVVDRVQGRVTATWKQLAADNYPMALDETHGRLLVGCRSPAEVLVIDTESGKVLTKVSCDGDVDDLFIYGATGRAYASCGSGFVDVLATTDPDELTGTFPTREGTRTSLLVPEWGALFLAVPAHGKAPAEIRECRLTKGE